MNKKLRRPQRLWAVAENRDNLERLETLSVALVTVQVSVWLTAQSPIVRRIKYLHVLGQAVQTLCIQLKYFSPTNEGNDILRNVVNCKPNDTAYLNKEYLNVCKNSCAKFNFSTINITVTILSYKARTASEKFLKNIRRFCNVCSINWYYYTCSFLEEFRILTWLTFQLKSKLYRTRFQDR
jgi:hypothetical protein